MYNIIYNNNRLTFGNFNVGIELPVAYITYSTVEHGTIYGEDRVLVGTTVTVTATPSTGYVLSYITVNGVQIEGNSFVATENATVSAVFTGIVRTVTTTSSPVAGGSVTAAPNTGIIGTEVTLSNTPAEGYTFNGYTISGATLSGNTLTIGESDVAVTGKFISAYGYYTGTANVVDYRVISGNCVSGIPINNNYNYYVPVKEYMSGPQTFNNTFSYNVSRSRVFVCMNDNGPDNVTSLTINLNDDYAGIVIGDNTFNNLTSLSLNLYTHPIINIGNNSMNTASQITNFTFGNADGCVCYIGDNSCRNFNITIGGSTGPIKVGNNSLRTLTLNQDIKYYFSSGNFGAHLDVSPLIIHGQDRVEMHGDIKSMIQASMNARSSSVKVIDYDGSSYTSIRCPDCSSSDISWLNTYKSNFMNDPYGRARFSN